METLIIDPQVESKVKTHDQPAQPTTPLTAAGRTVRVTPSWRDATKSKTQTVPRARNLAQAEMQIYRLGSPARRIAGAAIPLAFACLLLFSQPPPPAFFQCLWYGGCILGAWQALKSPYILHTGRDWAEFVSLTGDRKVHAVEIREIVRKVPSGTGAVNHLVIKLKRGSVTLATGREEIFKALKRVNPAVHVTTEEYDDSAD